MSTGRARGGGRQFPVGRRRRYVPVVDSGCGCRPRQPRLLSLLPPFSFLIKPCQQQLGAVKPQQQQRAAARGEQSSCAASTAASFSSSSAATRSSTGYASAYSSSDYYYHYYPTATAKQQQALLLTQNKQQDAASPAAAGKRHQLKARKKKQQQQEKEKETEDAGAGVGVAVEKESSDPRADFRDSMVQMVVEMGLCDWDGLRGMLRRLLALNAPRHHAAILTAFAEVCTQLAGAAAAPLSPQRSPAAYQHLR